VNEQHHASALPENKTLPTSLPTMKEARELALLEIERQYLQQLMDIARDDMQAACQISGLHRARLYELLKKYQISR